MAAPLGIRLAPPDQPSRVRPAEVQEKAFEAFASGKLAPFIGVLGRRDDSVEPPPPDMAAFRAEHVAEIDGLIVVLLSSDVLWDRTLRVDGPLPSLLGLRHLTSVLLLEALERDRAGDEPGAVRAIEACAKLSADLRS